MLKTLDIWWRGHLARTASQREDRALTERWQWGYATRLDWPDGTHDFFGFHPHLDGALRLMRRNRTYWRGGSHRPAAWTPVAISRAETRDHHGCTSPHCPRTAF